MVLLVSGIRQLVYSLLHHFAELTSSWCDTVAQAEGTLSTHIVSRYLTFQWNSEGKKKH